MNNINHITLDNEKGFTLVEILVSIAILSFGLLAVAAMQNSALLGTGKSKSVTEATTVAMDRMERLFAMPFDTLITSYSTGTTYGDSDFPVDPPAPPATIESITWEISDTASLPPESAKKIKVTAKSKSMKTPVVLENIKLKIS